MPDSDDEAVDAAIDGLAESGTQDDACDPSKTSDPVRLAADVMVRRAIACDPSIAARGEAPGAVAVLLAPAGWEEDCAHAWGRVVLSETDTEDDGTWQARRVRERLESKRALRVLATTTSTSRGLEAGDPRRAPSRTGDRRII